MLLLLYQSYIEISFIHLLLKWLQKPAISYTTLPIKTNNEKENRMKMQVELWVIKWDTYYIKRTNIEISL